MSQLVLVLLIELTNYYITGLQHDLACYYNPESVTQGLALSAA